MDAILQKLLDTLVSSGPMGVIVIALGYAYWHLQKRHDVVQEKRVEDAMKLANAYHAVASALDRNTETLRAFAED